MKTYKYEGEEFEITQPKDCVMAVSGKGLRIDIKIHPTNRYWDYFGAENYGYFHTTVDAALKSACKRILAHDRQKGEDLCTGLDEFYGGLDGP